MWEGNTNCCRKELHVDRSNKEFKITSSAESRREEEKKKWWLPKVDVDAYGNLKNGHEPKEDDAVDKDGGPIGLHVAELYYSTPPWELEQQTRG